jgi:ribulose-5-phosphate 4-epimerase/fuculose-1-phosphate aldolase
MSSVARVAKANTVRAQVSAAEWKARIELAAAYRLIAHFGIRDLTYNHLSVRVPGEPDKLLIKCAIEMFEEVTASSLFKYDLDGNPVMGTDRPLFGGGLIIHAGLLKARPDLNVVFHTHSPANMAVSAMKCGLLPINQHSIKFHNRLAHHRFRGFEFDPHMTEWLLDDLGPHRAMLLENHGILIVGDTIAEAFVQHHFLEWACQAQVMALAGGIENVKIPDAATCEHAAKQVASPGGVPGGKDWDACLRLADRIDPSYKE